jgi:hypothetical protein
MDGNGILLPESKPAFSSQQIACIDLLKEALALALEGQIDCIGIALCMHGGYSSNIAGNRPAELMLATFDLQCQIREATQGGPKTQAIRSRIVKARSM